MIEATDIPEHVSQNCTLPARVVTVAERWSRRISLHIARGEFEVAHNLIELAEREWRESQRKKSRKELLAMPLAETNLRLRLVNLLARHGVVTVRDALHHSQSELLSIHNFGPMQMHELMAELERLGFRASGEDGHNGQ